MKNFLLVFLCLLFGTFTINAATLTVTTTADSNDGICDADCSLREAIAVANNGDTIEFSALFNLTQTIALNGTELEIDKSLTINGTGADKLSIDAGFASRVINITGISNTITINDVKIASGFNSSPTDCNGGGISIRDATVNLDKVHIDFNFAASNTGANCAGGGIFNFGILNLTNSTLSNNSVSTTGSSLGGGIYNGFFSNPATANISNTTFSGNSATTGGGIYNQQTMTLTSVTITSNFATGLAGYSGIANGFIANTTLRSTLVAANQNNRDAFGNYNSAGFNLIGNGDNATSINQPTDQVGTLATPIDPMLGILGNNGGTTPTHSVTPSSPAFDKGNSFGLNLDQRGQNRTRDSGFVANANGGDGTDIGAFEALAPTAAGITISGRVLGNNGRNLSRVVIEMSDFNGNKQYTRTNQFGHFQFEDIEAGQTYIFNAYSKQVQFAPQIITPTDNVTNLIFSNNSMKTLNQSKSKKTLH